MWLRSSGLRHGARDNRGALATFVLAVDGWRALRWTMIAHYLIADPAEALILHHARADGDAVVTRIVREETIALDPPSLALVVADVYGA
jgi:hypothetical protein